MSLFSDITERAFRVILNRNVEASYPTQNLIVIKGAGEISPSKKNQVLHQITILALEAGVVLGPLLFVKHDSGELHLLFGLEALHTLQRMETALEAVRGRLGASSLAEVPAKVNALLERLQRADAEVERLTAQLAARGE